MTIGEAAVSSLAIALLAGPLCAQTRAPVRPELRIDATSATVDRLELSGGAAVPLGTYVRVALLAGGGLARDDTASASGKRSLAAARADVIARFQIDPFHQSRRGVYGGGGISYLATEGHQGRLYVAVVAGLELRDRGHVAPAVEVALGGGLRVSVALRRSASGWR